jgi:hypothetical protein
VDFCIQRARVVIVAALIVGIVAGGYAVQYVAINTDISKLISPDLPWRQRQLAFEKAFPERSESILAVVHAPTLELASAARNSLLDELLSKNDLFRAVRAPDGRTFFDRNFLLYLPIEELARTTEGLIAAGPRMTAKRSRNLQVPYLQPNPGLRVRQSKRWSGRKPF